MPLDAPLQAEHWLVAGGIGVYVAGVTWFARRESGESSRRQLALATAVMVAGHRHAGLVAPLVRPRPFRACGIDPSWWYLLMGVLGLLIVWRCLGAVIEPVPGGCGWP